MYQGPKSIKQHPQGIAIVIGAKPNSKLSKITEINDQYVGVSINAPPRDGQANQQLVRYFGQLFGMRKNGVYLAAGQKSKDKVIILEGNQFTLDYVYQTLKKQI